MYHICLKRTLTATAAGAASIVILTGAVSTSAALAAPAAARTSCSEAAISVSNIGISSTNTYAVKGTLTSCGATTAFWDMDGGPGYEQNVSGWGFDGSTTAYAYYYPDLNQPLGNYKAAGTGAWDSQYTPVPQNTAYFAIKLDSSTRIYGYRSGDDVYVHAYVGRYNPSLNYGSGGWQPSEGRSVTFYNWHNTWNKSGSARTGSNGWTPYVKIYATTGRSFRAYAGYTWNMWGNQSSSIYR
jgi:hypothetical protein